MSPLLRTTLAALAASAAVPGLLATVSPSAFYSGFPFGRGWVGALPPYNEHLIHDVGNYKTAFAILFAWARGGRYATCSCRWRRRGSSRRRSTWATTRTTWTDLGRPTRSR